MGESPEGAITGQGLEIESHDNKELGDNEEEPRAEEEWDPEVCLNFAEELAENGSIERLKIYWEQTLRPNQICDEGVYIWLMTKAITKRIDDIFETTSEMERQANVLKKEFGVKELEHTRSHQASKQLQSTLAELQKKRNDLILEGHQHGLELVFPEQPNVPPDN